ncbi:MAG: hypothetical protein QOH73_145, partial [Gaiellaceae bacterium]|nr:hypothetical protein [Gaiellaceae bacterium]
MSDIGTHGNNGDAEAAHESDVRVWVHKDDLIDDRALQNDADDEFRLADVVEEVAGLCEAASLPATVALYGSWGSGKSSLANLLAARFAHNRDVAFARFDAFKYAEVPLRRHFLSQVAKTFKVKDKKFDRGLYTSTKHVRLDMPARKWFALAGLILIAVAVTIGLASIAAFLVALVAPKGTLWANFTKTLEASVPAIALATPIIAAALTLLGQVFTADSTTDAPSSDEQFEALFSELVKAVVDKKKCKRIVIFIDELDRCSPRQVVAALETLRTFLEVKPCIFIVAADQQVLEHALTGAARQATPFNAANPYYSAGSGYLDKIFQYQLQLPPILTGRLSHYALRLIEGRQGVWSYLHNRPELVSVLIPTHVRSPRRVKVLLNAFALLYGLALRRAAEGVIEGVEERAAQVAKLVCLKTEFPLFAVDLQLDSRLPDIVLRLHEKEDEKAVKADYPGLSDEAFERAKGYANENRAVDQVIAQVVANPSGDGSPDLEADGARDVEASHAQQLLRYLQRTREIPSPQRDLVYLDSSGAAFGLPAELAEQLEFDALDGSTEDVAEAVEALDPDDQLKALRLLARLVVEAVGIEARNVAQALFAAIAVNSADIAPVADDLLNALVTYNSGYELEADDVVGALQLALSHDGAAALRMREEVVSRDEVLTETDLGLLVLAHLTQLRAHLARVALALTGLLERSGGAAAERALAGVADADVKALLEAV